MKITKSRRARGRPIASSDGAPEAHDEIVARLKATGMQLADFARYHKLDYVSVWRAMSDRSSARWTPTFTKIYAIAVNNGADKPSSGGVGQRLNAYQGPGEVVVRRILSDLEELLGTLAARRAR